MEARPGSSQTRRRRRRLGTTGAQPAPALHPPAVRICRTCKATGGGLGGWGGTTGLRRLDTGGDPRPEAFPPPLPLLIVVIHTPSPAADLLRRCVCAVEKIINYYYGSSGP